MKFSYLLFRSPVLVGTLSRRDKSKTIQHSQVATRKEEVMCLKLRTILNDSMDVAS